MSRKILFAAGVAVAVAAAWTYATPYLVVKEMRAAARAHDVATLSTHIDYPALRANTKAHFDEMVAQQAAQAGGANNAGNELTRKLLAALVEPMVNALVSPESLATMMAGKEEEKEEGAATPAASAPGAGAGKERTEVRAGYEGFNHFTMALRLVESGREPVVFVLERQAIVNWKLVALRISLPKAHAAR